MQNVPLPALESAGLRCSLLDRVKEGPSFDFIVEGWEFPDGLTSYFSYRKMLYGASTIASMAEHWNRLLLAMAESPEAPISRLPRRG